MKEFQAITKDENGNLIEVSNKIHVGVSVPADDYKVLWIDPLSSTIKVKYNGMWIPFIVSNASKASIAVTSPANMPTGYSVVVVNARGYASSMFTFKNTLSAGARCRVVVNFNEPEESANTTLTLLMPQDVAAYKFIPNVASVVVAKGGSTVFDVVSDGTTMYITNPVGGGGSGDDVESLLQNI